MPELPFSPLVRHRVWLAALVAWPVALACVQVGGDAQLAPLLAIYCALCALVIVLGGRSAQISVAALVVPPMAVYLIARPFVLSGTPGTGSDGALLEALAVGVTALLARRATSDIAAFEAAVERSITVEHSAGALPLEDAEAAIYSELKRARSFERHVTILSIAPADLPSEKAMELIEEVQRAGLDRYVRARVAGLLTDRARDYDILASRDRHLVSVLPETDAEQARGLVERLRASCREELGIELRIGAASFPDQELTYAKLLERAESGMHEAAEAEAAEARLETESSRLAG